ncbi:hypothetical protein HU200_054410 [Digitaria exilis]|uniref:non-specific serine/threonine protein kinase n=1 Tax=Digitaria exilis TaxID=1010633 RepID=A0A835AV62_9POAL|nr:hypothetical protein HU200_054410 [Digitaria exilis]
MASTTNHLASSPAGAPPGPNAPPPQSSSASPPPPKASSSPPPPPPPSTPPPPQHSTPPPPPPANQSPSPPPPAPSGKNSTTSPFDQSLVKTPPSPPEKSPSTSPPPPSSPPPSPPPTSPSPPPPSSPSPPPPPPPASSTTPSSSHQSPPESTTPSETATPPPPQSATSASGSRKPPPPPPDETPSTPGTPRPPPAKTTQTTTMPPPTSLTVIMPSSGMWRGQPGSAATAPPLGPPAGSSGSGSSLKTEVLIVLSVAGIVLSLASLFIFLYFNNNNNTRRRRRPPWKHNIVVSPEAYQPAASGTTASSPSYEQLSGTKSWFTYDELAGITGGFAAANVIGEGGFGKVYMGTLPAGAGGDERRRVAVKQLKVGGGQGEKEFRAEVDIISRIHHRHLVTLVGYCVTQNHRLLVYEFVSNKTLDHHLHGRGLPVMDWHKRMKIAIGAARGLTYLHEDCHPRIIHRDIKSANILIDEGFEAKVADFGLAKLTNDSLTHISTRVMGTFGYMAPEYASSGKLTDRSDVFSFGVVLLELITGRKPVDASQPLGEESLVEWARALLADALEAGDFGAVADPALEGRFSRPEMRRMVGAAAACVRHSAAKRPRMVQVWRSLDVEDDEGGPPDLTNGVKVGQSMAYDSRQYSADIELFRRMAAFDDGDELAGEEDEGGGGGGVAAGSRAHKYS